jgi:hypothetical protein
LVINDAMLNWPRGIGQSATVVSLPSIFCYKNIAEIMFTIVARFGYGKAYEALKELAENNGVKLHELQRFFAIPDLRNPNEKCMSPLCDISLLSCRF